MIKPLKKSPVYLDPLLHKILKKKAAITSRSISDLVNEAVRYQLQEDRQDLADIKKLVKEPTVSFEKMLKNLRLQNHV